MARAEIEIALDVATAFAVFTEEVNAWYRVDHYTVSDPSRPPNLRFEGWVGGRFVDLHDEAAGTGTVLGRITAWEPPHRLAFVDGRDCEVVVRFSPAGAGTRVRIDQAVDRLPPDVADHVRRYGWHTVASWYAHHIRVHHTDMDNEEDIAMTASTTDVRFTGLTPYLFYEDAAAMLQWYSRVFGWTEHGRWSDDGEVVSNAEMNVGTGELWLDGGGHKYFARDGSHGQWIGVWVDDVEAMYARVQAAGVTVDPPVDEPYGVRRLSVTDPEGYTWGFIKRLP